MAEVASASENPIAFSSSNLPILVIDTGGKEIPDKPKITARLGFIDNGGGARNSVPDPFNAGTTLLYQLPGTVDVSVEIYTMLGMKVRSWRMPSENPGRKILTRDGCDFEGRTVHSGVYLARISAGPVNQTLKLAVLR